MTTIYDSRGFVKRLTEAGMPEGQAETLADENLLLIAEHLATKDDVKALESALHADMAQLRTELRSEMAELRTELRSEMMQLRTELLGEMNALEARLVAKLGDRIIAVGGVIAAIVVALAAVAALV